LEIFHTRLFLSFSAAEWRLQNENDSNMSGTESTDTATDAPTEAVSETEDNIIGYTDYNDSDSNSDENRDNTADENGEDENAGERIVTDIENAADDLVSDGGDILKDAGDAITGN
jgi:hypothetical protein